MAGTRWAGAEEVQGMGVQKAMLGADGRQEGFS